MNERVGSRSAPFDLSVDETMEVEMRGFDHDKEMKLYNVGPSGIVMGETLRDYEGILTGAPRRPW